MNFTPAQTKAIEAIDINKHLHIIAVAGSGNANYSSAYSKSITK